jgi:hypothetical protein
MWLTIKAGSAMNTTTLHDLGRYVTRKGMREAEKNEARHKLYEAVAVAHEPIFKATTVFPLTLFPDTVMIDRTKLTITHRFFFKVADVISIKIEDILNVTPHVGPFFGSIEIHTRFFDPHKPYTVKYLWRDDALRFDRIMHGYSIALSQKIDCSSLEPKELAATLDKLGQGTTRL